jgi:hypothetical protein
MPTTSSWEGNMPHLPNLFGDRLPDDKSTFPLIDSDCRDELDGYHHNVWEDLCDHFGLDPDKTDCIYVTIVSVDEKGD